MRRVILLLALAILLVPVSLRAGCRDKLLKIAKTKADTVLVDKKCSWQSKIRLREAKTFDGKGQIFIEHYLRDVMLGSLTADTSITTREMIRLPDSVKFNVSDTVITSDSLSRELAFQVFCDYIIEVIRDNHPHYVFSAVHDLDLSDFTDRYFKPLQEPFCSYQELDDSTFSALILIVRISEETTVLHVFVEPKQSHNKPAPAQIVQEDQVASLIPQKDKERHARDFAKGQRCEILQLHVAWRSDSEIWHGPFYFFPAMPNAPWVLIGTREGSRVYAFAMPL